MERQLVTANGGGEVYRREPNDQKVAFCNLPEKPRNSKLLGS